MAEDNQRWWQIQNPMPSLGANGNLYAVWEIIGDGMKGFMCLKKGREKVLITKYYPASKPDPKVIINHLLYHQSLIWP